MIYNIFHPTPLLSDIVDHYWYTTMELPRSVDQHYPTPLLQGMAFNFKKQTEYHSYHGRTLTLYKQAYMFGQPTCPRVITTNEKGVDLLGVKFKPLGLTKITGINMEHMADRIIAAEDIWGNELELLCDEMQSAPTLEETISVLERFLLHKYTCTRLHYRVSCAQSALDLIDRYNGNIEVKRLQEQTNISRKTLERAFMHYLGLKPKFYSEIVRFNAAKQLMNCSPDLSVSDVSFRMGYYDSSHLGAAFKRFSGTNPTDYMENLKRVHVENAHFREKGTDSSS